MHPAGTQWSCSRRINGVSRVRLNQRTCWRRGQSRANPSLHARSLVNSENTGNLLEFGLSTRAPIVPRDAAGAGLRGISLRSRTGKLSLGSRDSLDSNSEDANTQRPNVGSGRRAHSGITVSRRSARGNRSQSASKRSGRGSHVRRGENAGATAWAIVPAGQPCGLGEMVATDA